MEAIENFFFDHIVGKLIARGVMTLIGFLAAHAGLTSSYGVSVSINPAVATAAATAAAHAGYELYKHWRTSDK